jgi:hypothetical protein
MKEHRYPLLIALLFSFYFCMLISPDRASPQVSNCPSVPSLFPYPPKGMWPQGSMIHVNIDPTFTQEQKNAIVGQLTISWPLRNRRS